MATLNPFISNGTCYFAAGRKSDAAFAPCGNDAFGHKPCCQLHDSCIGHNACYNEPYGTTYLAGCSDPHYKDSSCPDKADLVDTPWAGLVYCNGTSNEWHLCEQHAKPATVAQPDACFCPNDEAERRFAFSAPISLDNVAVMPTAHGGSVAFHPGHFPTQGPITVTAAPTGPAPAADPAATSFYMPTNDSVATGTAASGGSAEELPVGTKVGIGLGVSVVSLSLLGLIVFLLIRRRHAQTPPASPPIEQTADRDVETSPMSELPHLEAKHAGFQPSPLTPSADARFSILSHTPSELGGKAARPWSVRSELQGCEGQNNTIGLAIGHDEQPGERHRALTPVAELPG